MKETERNRRLLLLLDKLISNKDLESIELIETMVANDTDAMKQSFKIMKKSLEYKENETKSN